MKLINKHCLILAASASLFTSFEATAQVGLHGVEPLRTAVSASLDSSDEEYVSMPGLRGAIEGRSLNVDITTTTFAHQRAQQNFILLRDNMEGQTVLQIQEQGQRIFAQLNATSPSLAVSYQAAFETKAAVRFQHKLAALTQAYYNNEAAIRFTGFNLNFGIVPTYLSPAWNVKYAGLLNWLTVGIRSSFPYLITADNLEVGLGGWAQQPDLIGTPRGRAALFARQYDLTGR
jgi:hypothetical protein